MSRLLSMMVSETGMSEGDLRRIIYNAPARYRTYRIAKRSGGWREISQPTPEVKFAQRALVRVLLSKLPIHACATAYRPGYSIRENVEPHKDAGPILKMDFRNFFPSIRSRDWQSYCRETGCLEEPEEIFLTSQLLFQKPRGGQILRLAIGAPSSPILSNILMYKIDEMIRSKVAEDHIVYTRYADDMTFSARRTGYLVRTISDVAKIIRNADYPKLEINGDKTTYVTKKYGRHVTGLTISNDGEISIGRENKRKIHAAVFNAKKHGAEKSDLQILAGMLAYVKSVDPAFFSVLSRKYGSDTIERLQKSYYLGHKPPRHSPPIAKS